ncbi:MAG: TolC family protein [Pseudomonadota bacterium]
MSDVKHTRRFRLALQTGAALALLAPSIAARAQDSGPAGRELDETRTVTLAVEHNPALAAAIIDLERAEQQVLGEQARYGFVLKLDQQLARLASPTLSGSGVSNPSSTSLVLGGELQRHLEWGTDLSLRVEGQAQTSQSSSFTQPGTLVDVGPGYSTSVRMGFSQPLLRGAGRDVSRASLDQAEVALASAKVARQRVASEVLQGALSAYWELYYASRALDIQQQSLQLAEQQRDQAAARVASGDLAPVELLTFESRVAALHEDLASAEAERESRAIALGQAIGVVDGARDLRARAGDQPSVSVDTTDALRAAALASSYRVLELREAMHLAEVQARTAAEPLRPRLDLTGYVQAQGLGNQDLAPAFSGLASSDGVSAMVGLSFETPLDGTQRESEAARARLAVQSAQEQLNQAEQAVVADLDTARARAQAAARRTELSAQTLSIVQRQVVAEEARFATGSSTALDVSQAQDQLRASSLRELRARVDSTQLRLQLLHLTGRLLEVYGPRAG